ncbi:MFS transporter [Desulfolithobacter sp.]
MVSPHLSCQSRSLFRLQMAVFALVATAFTNIYITQPVLPRLQQEFGAGTVTVSLTVSAVILGIALANLPFGILADRWPIRPIILTGGIMVALNGLVCALTSKLWILISARFLQGLFLPALTTCLATYLARTMPPSRLSVILGSYVSATVLGGMSGRILGGWIHPPDHWRQAFISAALLTICATIVVLRVLPAATERNSNNSGDTTTLVSLLRRDDIRRIYLCVAGGFAIFSTVFNYLPFRLGADPFSFSARTTTTLYLAYIIGIFMGPVTGKLSNLLGNGVTMIGGSLLMGVSLILILLPLVPAVIAAVLGLCAGFFTIHAAAVGALNRKLSSGHGKANALYVLLYYLGGWLGISGAGFAYEHGGWQVMISLCLLLLLLPIHAGVGEIMAARASNSGCPEQTKKKRI